MAKAVSYRQYPKKKVPSISTSGEWRRKLSITSCLWCYENSSACYFFLCTHLFWTFLSLTIIAKVFFLWETMWTGCSALAEKHENVYSTGNISLMVLQYFSQQVLPPLRVRSHLPVNIVGKQHCHPCLQQARIHDSCNVCTTAPVTYLNYLLVVLPSLLSTTFSGKGGRTLPGTLSTSTTTFDRARVSIRSVVEQDFFILRNDFNCT